MPIWITAVGIGCLGSAYGYMTFYSFRRHHPPISIMPLPVSQVVLLLLAIGTGGVLGSAFIAMEGVNYAGPYGVGFLSGMIANIHLTRQEETIR